MAGFPDQPTRNETDSRVAELIRREPTQNDAPARRRRRFGAAREPENMGRFQILRRLGAGGMGVVYEALDPARDERVAIKTLQGLDPGALYRFKQEFRSLADISHPNIVSLHELFADDDRLFFTMELLQAVSFLSWVRERPTSEDDTSRDAVDVRALRSALAQLVAGLDHLHEHGKLHRDVKPSNVLVTRDGRVVLLDFGLARDEAPSVMGATIEAGVVGTPAYMSPEQACGEDLTPASDWYSVGVMLYRSLTGRLPVSGKNVTNILSAKTTAEVVPPREINPDAPGDLEALCLELLAIDPAKRPNGKAIAVRVGSVTQSQSGQVPSTTVFVGRTRELQTLRSAFADASRGRPGVVFLSGPSGFGKSALVREFLGELREDTDVAMLRGRCFERESVPFKAVDAIIDELTRYLSRLPLHQAVELLPRSVHALARLFPVFGRVEAVALVEPGARTTVDPLEVRDEAFRALKEIFYRIVERRPLVLHIDDMQWGDRDSVALLLELFRGVDPVPLMLVVSHRSEESAAAGALQHLRTGAATLDRRVDLLDLQVGALSVRDSTSLAETLLATAGLDPKSASAIAREADGSPYFVQELVRHLATGESAEAVLGAPGSVSLATVLSARFERLPPPAWRLLQLISVSGRQVSQSIARAAGPEAIDRRFLTMLQTERLIRVRGGESAEVVEPYHDRIREAVVAGLEHPVIRQLHRDLAHALEHSGEAHPVDLLWHYRAAGDESRALAYALAAADRAAESLAFDRAAELFDLARELAGDEPSADLDRKLGDALANAGRGRDAALAYLRAVKASPEEEHFELEVQAAQCLLLSGHREQGKVVLNRALERVGLSVPESEGAATRSLLWARMRLKFRGLKFQAKAPEDIPVAQRRQLRACWAAARGLYLSDLLAGAYFQTEYLLRALDAGSTEEVVVGLAFEARSASFFGGKGLARARELIERARGASSGVASPHVLAVIESSASLISLMGGRWRKGVEQADRAEKILRRHCTGQVEELYDAHAHATAALSLQGRVGELGLRVRRAAAEAAARDNRYHELMATYMVAYPTLIGEGETQAATELVARCREQGAVDIEIHNLQSAVAALEVHLACGRGREAWELLQTDARSVEKLILLRALVPKVSWLDVKARSAISAALETNDPALLKKGAALNKRLEKLPFPTARPLAMRNRAELLAASGDRAEAGMVLRTAIGAFDELEMLVPAAAARMRLAELVGEDEARGLREHAGQSFEAEGVAVPGPLIRGLAPGYGG